MSWKLSEFEKMNQIEEKRSRSAEEAGFGGGGRLERSGKWRKKISDDSNDGDGDDDVDDGDEDDEMMVAVDVLVVVVPQVKINIR